MPDAPLLSWTASRQRAIDRAIEVLRAGGVLALPTETVYGLATARQPGAAARLDRVKERAGGKPYALAVPSLAAARVLVPHLGSAALRLAERYWPGPLTLVVPGPNGSSVGLRVPSGEPARQILAAWGQPLLLTSANRADQAPCTDAPCVHRELGDRIDLIIDDGPTPIKEASTVVRFGRHGLEVLRSGLVDRSMIHATAGIRVLIVCTGNTCRSPMAEATLSGLLARALGVAPSALPVHGIEVASGGIHAQVDARVSPEAVAVMESQGWSLPPDRRARPLEPDIIQRSTRIYVMTRQHRDELCRRFPEAVDRLSLLHREGLDISDPIGRSVARYAACAREMEAPLRILAREILEELMVPAAIRPPSVDSPTGEPAGGPD